MAWRQAEATMLWISIAIGFLGFAATLLYLRGSRHDWLERLARACFIWLQCALWAATITMVVMAVGFHIDFGGTK